MKTRYLCLIAVALITGVTALAIRDSSANSDFECYAKVECSE